MPERVTKEEKMIELAILKAKEVLAEFSDGTTVANEQDVMGEEVKLKSPPKNPKEEAILIAKQKCWKDNPTNKDGCLIDQIIYNKKVEAKLDYRDGSFYYESKYNYPSVKIYLWEEELSKYYFNKEDKTLKIEPFSSPEF